MLPLVLVRKVSTNFAVVYDIMPNFSCTTTTAMTPSVGRAVGWSVAVIVRYNASLELVVTFYFISTTSSADNDQDDDDKVFFSFQLRPASMTT